jgi:multimeric flavodoxin WrbA
MNIVVLNGSPKGDLSVTMQSIEFLKFKFPGENIEIINIAEKMNRIEKDEKFFNEIMAKIGGSDGVLWAFPLYHMLVHSNYKRFIELVIERGAGNFFAERYAAGFSTSIHFSDNTAMNYIEGIAGDLGMNFCESFCAEMHDLMKPWERDRLVLFFDSFLYMIKKRISMPRRFAQLKPVTTKYSPGEIPQKLTTGKRITVITDVYDPASNIGKMIDRFRGQFDIPPALGILSDTHIKGACLGCCRCGPDNVCAYEGTDDFRKFWETYVIDSDIVIIAGEMKDRYFSHRIKQMFDRSFYLTHQPVFFNKQMGYIVSGPLSQDFNFRTIMEMYPDTEQGNLCGIVSDESGDSAIIDKQISTMAANAVRYAEAGYIRPSTFLGVGGRKVFRDEMFGNLKLVFQKDYLYYKKHGWFDFPHKKKGARILNVLLWPLLKIKNVRRVFLSKMKGGIVAPSQKTVRELKAASAEKRG